MQHPSDAPFDPSLGADFLAIAARHADRPAFRFTDGSEMTYADLAGRARGIASWLASEKIGKRDVVAIQHGKTGDGYAAMLACIILGAVYTVLDDSNPAERLHRILSLCKPRIVVSDAAPSPSVIEACHRQSLRIVELRAIDVPQNPPPINFLGSTGADPAYIMFTSGSTGFPKGVVISRSSVANFVRWSRSEFGIGPRDVLTNVNPIYFDNSVFDFFTALFTGACLAPVGRDLARDPHGLVEAVARQGCTVWFSVPSLLIYMTAMRALPAGRLPPLRTVVFGGEGYPLPELRKLRAALGDKVRLVNVYGPTECTCICSAHDVTAEILTTEKGLPPLGRIAANIDHLILDENDAPCPPGEAGELCLLGPQLALGYYNDAERSAASFVDNPLNPSWHETMYRTGDLVRKIDGLLHFVGRKDNQIKHQGYRIELDEIEAALNTIPSVVQAAVVYRRKQATHGQIVACLAVEGPIEEGALRSALKGILPAYMIPSRFEFHSELPKNANGKVDRVRLRET